MSERKHRCGQREPGEAGSGERELDGLQPWRKKNAQGAKLERLSMHVARPHVWIQAAIETAMEGRTTVVVAHRLSTIQQVDRIAVLNRGQLAELGRHEELLAQEGIYRKLYDTYFAAGSRVDS